MMEWAGPSLELVKRSHSSRVNEPPVVFSDAEAEKLIKDYHPDCAGMERKIQAGPSAGVQSFPLELADLLESDMC